MRISFKHIVTLAVLICCLFSEYELVSQNSANQDTEIVNDSKREEIQRYFGYELLLYRYLSLPYDVSINTNQTGNFVDIGFLYLFFIPVLLLLYARKRIMYYLAGILTILLLWIVSTSNGFIYSNSFQKIDSSHQGLDAYLNAVSFSSEPFTHLVAYMYKFSLLLYAPLLQFGEAVSGDEDYITYPFIFLFFLTVSAILSKKAVASSLTRKIFQVFLWVYSFYWFAFSGGIIWYGYILLIAGLFFIYYSIEDLDNTSHKNVLKKAFVSLGFIWLIMTAGLRTSDIQPGMGEMFFAKGLFNPVYYDFASKKVSKRQATDLIYSDVSQAFDQINRDKNSLVWRIGTPFSYFVENNNTRVIQDNQLGMFYRLLTQYPDKLELTTVLKASNIRYLFVDLNTHTIDYTPDKSLTSKFTLLLNFVINNPDLQLLATDRVVVKTDPSGNRVFVKDIMGEEIYQGGRYAIYRIN